MVDIAERLCTPEQAMQFKEKGLIQTTQYAWCKEPDGSFVLEYHAPEGYPCIEDWSQGHNDCYAAFDNTDLGLMLASLGYYPAGPTFKLSDDNEAFRWWCDDINTFTSVEDTIYQGYGASEAEAKGNMLLKLLNLGIPRIGWKFYKKERLNRLRNEKKSYGQKPYNDDLNESE